MNRMTEGDDEARRKTALARREWHGVKLGKDEFEPTTAMPREIRTENGTMNAEQLVAALVERYLKRHQRAQTPMEVHRGVETDLAFNLYELLGDSGRENLDTRTRLHVQAKTEVAVNEAYAEYWKILAQPQVRATEQVKRDGL